jgi:hypothetical protein
VAASVAVVSAAAVGVAAEVGVAVTTVTAAVVISATAGADTSARIIDRSPVGVIATQDRIEKQKSGAPVSPTHLNFVSSMVSSTPTQRYQPSYRHSGNDRLAKVSAEPVLMPESMQRLFGIGTPAVLGRCIQISKLGLQLDVFDQHRPQGAPYVAVSTR